MKKLNAKKFIPVFAILLSMVLMVMYMPNYSIADDSNIGDVESQVSGISADESVAPGDTENPSLDATLDKSMPTEQVASQLRESNLASKSPALVPANSDPGLTHEAQIGDVYYTTLTEAIEAAKDGDLIKLISVDAEGKPKSVEIGTTWIIKKITIDMNGREIVSYGYSFCAADSRCDFQVINSGENPANLGGILYNYDNECKMTIGDKVEVANEIWANQNTVVDGNHLSIHLKYNNNLNGANLYPVTFGDSFRVSTSVRISFTDSDFANDLNNPDKPVGDILIAKNAKKELSNQISISGVNNPGVTLRVKDNGDLYIHKELSYEFYLNGVTGNDANDGKTTDSPVKSIHRLKALLAEPSMSGRKKIVYVTGTVSIKDKQSLEFPADSNVEIYRNPDLEDELFDIGEGGELSLSNVTIDGNQQKRDFCNGPLIQILKGRLAIKDGAILQNNAYTDFSSTGDARGGAIRALTGSKIEMSGGIIRWNRASMGGGIYAADSIINISGGLITENELMSESNERFSTGGGISAVYGSKVNMSGGTISANQAANGGGLSLGFYGVDMSHNYSSPELIMTGGTFENNIAEKSGGGLFIQGGSKFSQTQSIARIKGGTFRNNTAKMGMFGGGAIYVNGWHGNNKYSSGELHLENALIKGNDSKDAGGGYASCPTARTVSRVNDGVAIFDNKSTDGDDVSIHANVWFHGLCMSPPYELSPVALGGGFNHWASDDRTSSGYSGEELRLNMYKGYVPLNTALYVKSNLTSKEKAAAEKLAKVKIIGNHAGQYGGGIGSNGDVYFGTGDVIDLTVKKTWNDEKIKDKRPKKIKVAIYRALKNKPDSPKYLGFGEIYPDKDGNWAITFSHLPKGDASGDYTYTAKEIIDDETVNNYLQEVSGRITGEDGTIEIKNTYDDVKVKVKKVWDDDSDKDKKRPQSVTVRLLKNGKEIDSKVLSQENNWAFSFGPLPKYENGKQINYSITEDQVDGYESSVTSSGEYSFTIKNKHETKPSKPKNPEPKKMNPETGDGGHYETYFGILISISILLMILEASRRKNKEKF